jgi:hypothetical protein
VKSAPWRKRFSREKLGVDREVDIYWPFWIILMRILALADYELPRFKDLPPGPSTPSSAAETFLIRPFGVLGWKDKDV